MLTCLLLPAEMDPTVEFILMVYTKASTAGHTNSDWNLYDETERSFVAKGSRNTFFSIIDVCRGALKRSSCKNKIIIKHEIWTWQLQQTGIHINKFLGEHAWCIEAKHELTQSEVTRSARQPDQWGIYGSFCLTSNWFYLTNSRAWLACKLKVLAAVPFPHMHGWR